MNKGYILFSFILILISCNSLKKDSKPAAKSTTVPTHNPGPVTSENPVIIAKGPDTIQTASGLRYVILKHKGGSEKPNHADKVYVHYRAKLADGTEFDNSYDRGEPFAFQLGMHKVMKGWDEGIALLSLGDSALLIIPPHLGYGDIAKGGVPANSTLYFEVVLVKIKEPVFVNEYNWQNKPLHTTPSGLKYYVIKEGTGKQAHVGSTVKVHYTGYLSDGKIFESSVLNEEPIQFELGTGTVIKGWDEGILLMHQGSKYRFIVPPSLGYGEEKAAGGTIPANSTLTFDCELIEVK